MKQSNEWLHDFNECGNDFIEWINVKWNSTIMMIKMIDLW